MLSSEIATVLSGRYISVDMYPLNFSEFVDFNGLSVNNKLDLIDKKIELNWYLEQFIKFGGFPKPYFRENSCIFIK